jgi:broad specificity phosphatase PhoE
VTGGSGEPPVPGPDVVLVRHGDTQWSREGRHTGARSDPPLTDEGVRAALRLGRRLAGRRFTLVLSSPLQRAADTARLAGLIGAEGLQFEPDLVEWDYGDYEGLTTDEIQAEVPGWTVWTGTCPGGETIEQVAHRADQVIARILERTSPADAVALVAHGHILRVLGARWIDAPPLMGARLILGTACWSELGWEHASAAIARWNVA